MKAYDVNDTAVVPDEQAFALGGYAEICTYPWGGEYRPKARASLLRGADRFYLRMEALEPEENIRACETGISPVVHQDSCLEFFFCPEAGSSNYINLECGPAGSLHIAVGPDRQSRRLRRDVDIGLLHIQPFRQPQGEKILWGVTAEIPFSLVAYLLEKPAYQPGAQLRGNFYKCGDNTPSPHYGVWNPISWPQPDFHRPEFFGELRLKGG